MTRWRQWWADGCRARRDRGVGRLREEARDTRNWAESDRIRKELDERYRVTVKDTPQGAVWSVNE